ASVNSSGLVAANAAGSATITVRTSDGGYTATCAVTVTSSSAFTVTIEAEDYFEMYGIQTENTSDAGGGLNVGWIDAGDWMGYSVNLPAADIYTVEYRVASLNGGGNLQLEVFGGGTNYGSLDIPSTGGWQNWTTINHTVNLPGGQQDLAIVANSAGWNINWFAITRGIKSIETEGFNELSGISLFPNSAGNIINITGLPNNISHISVFDLLGKEKLSIETNNNEMVIIDISELHQGLYILVISSQSGTIQSLKFRKE
ncbi:MAG: carbohydrate-binding protein, partial [Bacteroidales bacterium]|nr:carbohydrate-binding protein [Bacteroidales bacterium]